MIKTVDFSFSYTEINKTEELKRDDKELLEAAIRSANYSYSPYSNFKVGAAVRLASGYIVTGTNVENAAFPSGICAERNALANAVSNHPGDIPVALAIAAANEKGITDDPVSPCGNCRQVIIEEEFRNGRPVSIILGGKNRIRIIQRAEHLLPLCFNRQSLDINSR